MPTIETALPAPKAHTPNTRRFCRSDPFERFYAERYPRMVRLATGMVDHQAVAEEIVQEGFHKVWLGWDRIDVPSMYLRTVVVSRCHDELRRRRVRRGADRCVVVEEAPETDYLADALSSMDTRRREAIVLRYYGGHTFAEVATAMNIPTGTAKSLIHRGLADLRGAFKF